MKRLWPYWPLLLLGETLLWLPFLSRPAAPGSILLPTTILAGLGYIILILLHAWVRRKAGPKAKRR